MIVRCHTLTQVGSWRYLCLHVTRSQHRSFQSLQAPPKLPRQHQPHRAPLSAPPTAARFIGADSNSIGWQLLTLSSAYDWRSGLEARVLHDLHLCSPQPPRCQARQLSRGRNRQTRTPTGARRRRRSAL